MNVIAVFRDADVGSLASAPEEYRERIAARAVLFDAGGNIALLHVTKRDCHKLPGGGVEEGESVEQALLRELLEETGCRTKNLREIGLIEEYRNGEALHQTSHCFLAEVDGEKGAPQFTPEEIAEGFELVWLPLTIAIVTLEEQVSSKDVEVGFMHVRDLALLRAIPSS